MEKVAIQMGNLPLLHQVRLHLSSNVLLQMSRIMWILSSGKLIGLCDFNFPLSRVECLLALLRADVDYNENVMEAECVLEHVLMVSESLDLSDEFGRRRLLDVVRTWLVCPQVPASLTKYLLEIYFKLETNVVSLEGEIIFMAF